MNTPSSSPSWTGTEDLVQPVCARNVTSCNPISGLEQTFAYYDVFEAPFTICADSYNDNVSDPCAAPSSCIAGAAQCDAEPKRWWIRLLPG